MFRSLRAAAGLAVLTATFSGGALAQEVLEGMPRELHGTWGADCASPEMLFEGRALQQRGDKGKSPVTRVVRRQGEIDVHYDRIADKVSVVDTFRVEGGSLRLTASQYGATRTAWNKRPWQRCGGAQPQQASAQSSGRRYPVVATIPIGPWTVTSNNDQAGKFAHCELMRRDGTLTFGITRGSAGYVMLMVDEGWTGVKAGSKYDLRLEGAGLQARSVSANSAAQMLPTSPPVSSASS